MIDAIAKHAPDDYEIIGVVGNSDDPGIAVADALIRSAAGGLPKLVREQRVDEIILATSEIIDGELFQSIMDCYEQGIPVTTMPLLYERLTNMVPVEFVGGHWIVVVPLEGESPFNPYPLLKRVFDIVLSLVGLVIYLALLPFLALAIKLDSPGPVFYRQQRVGRAGRLFELTKFRTMVPDAEVRQGPLWAVTNDPRVTRVGLFLRKTRLDELPQLWNILVGEMSLIGPRPERPFFVEHLQNIIPFYRTRLAVQPGLTGWAQVNYRYGSSEEDALIKLKYDLYYIRHRSLLLDALILLRTAARVIRLEGV
jgi:exopolysaccharide biosynthesis polyprenyl glycosylphosphotransferase